MDTLQSGVPLTVAQSTIYTLPSFTAFIQSTVAVELGVTTASLTLVAASTTGTETGAVFMRCTTSTTCVVIVKRFN